MSFFAYLLISVVLIVVSELLRPKPEIENAVAAGLGDFDFPTASEARSVPVIFGLVEMKAPNTLWAGDLLVTEIKQKVSTGMFSSKKVVVGHRYYISMHLGLCVGEINSLFTFYYGEKVRWEGDAVAYVKVTPPDPPVLTGPSLIHKLFAYGSGLFTFYPGKLSGEPPSSYLLAKASAQYPTTFGIGSVVFNRFYVGESPQLKKMSFLIKRIPVTLSATYSVIGGSYANPAHIIYEVLTNKEWGAGLSTGALNGASFLSVAETLYNEAFAMSLIWDNRKTYDALIKEVLKCIDGVLYHSISTGLLQLKLLRKDYVVADLPLFDESNILSLTDFAKPGYEETANELHLIYYDAEERKERTVITHDTGNLQAQGVTISVEKKYAGICTPAVANMVAARDLAVMACPMLKVGFYCDRDAYSLSPGDAIRFSWPARGIAQAVIRVIDIDFGTLDDGKIHISGVEDIREGSTIIYDASGVSGAITPDFDPVNIVTYLQIEAPYILRNFADYVETSEADADKAVQLYLAMSPSGVTVGYKFYEEIATAEYVLHSTNGGFCPSGTIYEAPGLVQEVLTASFTIDISSELSEWDLVVDDRNISGLLYCDGEFMSYESAETINDGTHLTFTNLHRGLLDTVPAVHDSIGTRIWSVANAAQLNQRYDATGNVTTVAQPVALGGELALTSCTSRAITFASRGLKPYPPGNWKLEGSSYPANFTGDLLVGWNHRNRELNTTQIWYQTDADVGAAETNTTYELKFYNTSGGGLLRTESGLTGITYTYLEADQLADNGGSVLPPGLRVTLTSSRDGYLCLQTHDWTTIRV